MIGGIQSGGSGAIMAQKHRARFDKMDKNGDGSLDAGEFAGMAKRSGKDASAILAGLDTNKDGKVDFGEMDAGMARKRGHAGPSQDSAVSQFTTALMNILGQIQDSKKAGGDADEDGKVDAPGLDAGTADHRAPEDLKFGAAASEFTTALLNIMKQLRDTGDGNPGSDSSSPEGSASAYGSQSDPGASAAAGTTDGTGKAPGTKDVLTEFQAALKSGFSFSPTGTFEMATLQGIA
jgi:hypothetical protein